MHFLQDLQIRMQLINPHIVCSMCAGYYIDATTITECLHTCNYNHILYIFMIFIFSTLCIPLNIWNPGFIGNFFQEDFWNGHLRKSFLYNHLWIIDIINNIIACALNGMYYCDANSICNFHYDVTFVVT